MTSNQTDDKVKQVIDQRDKDRAFFLKSFSGLVEKYDHIVLFPHVGPDGDCLGCAFGMQEIIRTNFPDKKAYVVGDSNGLFPWMNMQFDNFINYSFDFSNALAVIVDVGQSFRIQRFDRFFKNSKVQFGAVVKIDHHGYPSDFHVDLAWDDPTYVASCCQIVQIADFYGWKMTPRAATFLYLGICTDSLRFSVEAVVPRSLVLAAKTWRAGADHITVHRNLLRRSWRSIKTANYILDKCQYSDNIIWYHLTREEIDKFHLHNPKGLVNVFQDIEDHWIWMLFVDSTTEGYVNIDFRSTRVGVRELANKYNGGGHENAAGGRVKVEQIPDVVADAEKIVADAKKQLGGTHDSSLSAEAQKEAEKREEERAIRQASKINKESKEFLRETMSSGELGEEDLDSSEDHNP